MIEYEGWTCDVHRSGDLELRITRDIGPRIVYLSLDGKENLLHLIESEKGLKGGNDYRHYGGHRLWTTPEDISYTYHPENDPVSYENGWYSSKIDSRGLQKSIKIQTIPQGFLIYHKLKNLGTDTVSSSPWGITMLKPGGFSFFPNEKPIQHGPNSFLPVRNLSIWSYTKLNDPRLIFNDQGTIIRQQTGSSSFKIGASVNEGWGAYFHNGLVFLKTFFGAHDNYPDRGVNFEIYTDSDLLETETTGTVRNLKPGDQVICNEVWELFMCSEDRIYEECESRSLVSKDFIGH